MITATGSYLVRNTRRYCVYYKSGFQSSTSRDTADLPSGPGCQHAGCSFREWTEKTCTYTQKQRKIDNMSTDKVWCQRINERYKVEDPPEQLRSAIHGWSERKKNTKATKSMSRSIKPKSLLFTRSLYHMQRESAKTRASVCTWNSIIVRAYKISPAFTLSQMRRFKSHISRGKQVNGGNDRRRLRTRQIERRSMLS